MQGIEFLQLEEDKVIPGSSTRASMIIFLTDGQPTSGITDNNSILRNIQSANDGKILPGYEIKIVHKNNARQDKEFCFQIHCYIIKH